MNSKYVRPDTCRIGGRYYYQPQTAGRINGLSEVRFVSYRPNPAEVVIDDGRGLKVVQRKDLFQRNELDRN